MGFTPLLMKFMPLLIGLQLPAKTVAHIEISPLGCSLGERTYPDGSLTPDDRCIQYICINGTFEYFDRNGGCGTCHSTARNAAIETYDVHLIDEYVIPSYIFDGPGESYILSQFGLQIPSDLGIIATYGESRITNVLYFETGLTVEAVTTGPKGDAKILVNGKQPIIASNGSMHPLKSSVGTVYVSIDSPTWPQPYRGGNIHIVGSQGLSVSIYTLNGYAWFVNSYAMPTIDLRNGLYGLCDVFTKGRPENYTMQNGLVTTNINEFTESWKETDFCEPSSCQYFGAEGRCSKTSIENFVNVGKQQCTGGCECHIPGWCPNPTFTWNHVCATCNTPEDALAFAISRTQEPVSPNATLSVLDGRNISYVIGEYDNGPSCNTDFVVIWNCFADSDGKWTICTPYFTECFISVSLITGKMSLGGCLDLIDDH